MFLTIDLSQCYHVSQKFLNVVNKSFPSDTGSPKFSSKDNLSHGERQTLLDLRNNKSIVIKPADKGGAIVILNRTDYITKDESHLSDTITYEKNLRVTFTTNMSRSSTKKSTNSRLTMKFKMHLGLKTLRLRLCTFCPKYTNQEARPQCVP